MMGCVQWHSRVRSLKYPQGQGFMAAASMNRAGKVSDMEARAMETVPSSSGWRITSSTLRGNSGNSSRNSTPLWARETSPGRGTMPPPIKPASEIVVGRAKWTYTHKSCSGLEYSGDAMNFCRLQRLFESQRRENRWHALGEHRLSRSGRADHQDVMSTGACH